MLKILVLRISIFGYLTLHSLNAMSDPKEQGLPPILDYYPSCSYKIIKNHTLKYRAVDPRSPVAISKILRQLRHEAKQIGADALILVDKNVSQDAKKSYEKKQSRDIYQISYEAELIKNCIVTQGKEPKLARYNNKGQWVINNTSWIVNRPAVEIHLPEKVTLNHPKITNSGVSINNGIYGIPLGANYLTVLEKLGDPSVEVLLEGEIILGYGRRHWLHFQKNKLVKVNNNSQYLTSTPLNEVPLRDFFDDYEWKIRNKIAYNTTLEKVKEILDITDQLSGNDKLKIQQNGSSLTLHFESIKDPVIDTLTYVLKEFTLEKDSYKEQAASPPIQESVIYKAVEDAYILLQQEQAVNWQNLVDDLGEPLAKITLSVDSEVRIYSSNLLVKTTNSQLTTIHFIEQTWLGNILESKPVEPWRLGDFIQGQSTIQLERYFLENAYNYDGKVEMDTEKYNLSLFFDELSGTESLYEAKLEVY
tara:strand:+ start:104 stop:1531 length:1428 start_codon:yes stop_codon:yes gene_type:complete